MISTGSTSPRKSEDARSLSKVLKVIDWSYRVMMSGSKKVVSNLA